MLAVALALAVQVDEVVLRPPGQDFNVVNPAEAVVDPSAHLAYLLGRETAALGVLDLKSQSLKTVSLAAVGRSVHAHARTGTVYVLHAGQISISPRGAAAFRTFAVADTWMAALDPDADGLYLVCGPELLRVAPDGSTKSVLKGEVSFRHVALDPKRGLVHLVEQPSAPPVVHTRKLADGSPVAKRIVPRPADSHGLSGLHVHPSTGRVLAVLCDGFKDAENVLAIAPAESGDFQPHTLAGARDGQHSILDPSGRLLFVANDNSANVTIVDLSGDKPAAANVATGGKANGLAYDRRRDRLWVQTWSTRIACVDVAKRAPAGGFDAFSGGHLYRGIAVDEELGRVVVVSGYQGGSAAAAHDVREGKTKVLRTGCAPMDAVFAGGKLIVATNDDRVLSIDPATKAVAEIPTPILLARGLATEPKSKAVLVACGEWVLPNTLFWFDPATRKFAAGPGLPRGPYAVAAPGGASAWVLGWADEQLSEVDLDKRTLRKVAVPRTMSWTPRHLAATPDLAVLLRTQPAAVAVIRRGEDARAVALPAEPAAVAIDAKGNRAWIAAGQGDTAGAYALDLATLDVARTPLGLAPCDVAFDAAGGAVLVADLEDRAVHCLADGRMERVAMPGDAAPETIAVDGARGFAFAACRRSDRLLLARIRLKDLAVETVWEGAHAYGAEAGRKTWTRSTNTWLHFSRLVLDPDAPRGALVDYLGGRVILFRVP